MGRPVLDSLKKLVRPGAFPAGHFYSPIVDVADIEARRTSRKTA